MSAAVWDVPSYRPVTDGEIAVVNFESARRNAWNRVYRERRLEIAQYLFELESAAAQFLGDLSALDRLGLLTRCIDELESDPAGVALLDAQVASALHRFSEARECLAKGTFTGQLGIASHRLSLSIDQARGDNLEAVRDSRLRTAEASGQLVDFVALGAVLADLGYHDEADRTYERALREYNDVSPFAVAWVCFQRGVLWGELGSHSQPHRAAAWYERAVDYLPSYVKARVHLSEIYLSLGDAPRAYSTLAPVISCGDPEVPWRLAEALSAVGKTAEAEEQMEAARSGFEALLNQHLLAFADHGAEFYSGGGRDPARAFKLAKINLANRPALRAFEQAYETAVDARETGAASEILCAARERWGRTEAFKLSPLSVARDPRNLQGGRHAD
jgi:tetratricopeptide (TPR) repeat protein